MLIVAEVVTAMMVLCSVVPAILFVVNLRRYQPPKFGNSSERVAVLIPARDEELTIGDCLRSVLASHEVDLEVVVLDDDSADRTVAVVLSIMAQDSRVRLVQSGELPRGWNGKQHACWALAHETDAPVMLFLDADVRLQPWALARCVAARRVSGVALLSGFPRQITVGVLEWMMLPLIHFVLLGFLPLGKMRKTTEPAYAAGCGQFLLVEREAYFACGGHGAMRETRHDGLRMPRLFREHGYRTDLVDLTGLAAVRMYTSARAVWLGLAKNATEGLAAPKRIVPLSLLLFVGQVLPFVALVGCLILWARGAATQNPAPWIGYELQDVVLVALGLMVGVLAGLWPRLMAVKRFKQPLKSALLHPAGMALLLGVQWFALLKQMIGSPVSWRDRKYASETGEEV